MTLSDLGIIASIVGLVLTVLMMLFPKEEK